MKLCRVDSVSFEGILHLFIKSIDDDGFVKSVAIVEMERRIQLIFDCMLNTRSQLIGILKLPLAVTPSIPNYPTFTSIRRRRLRLIAVVRRLY